MFRLFFMLVSWIMYYFLYWYRKITYYFKAEISFERQVPDMDEVQRTTAQFHVPPMSSANTPLNIRNITISLLNSIEAFISRGSGWVITQIIIFLHNGRYTAPFKWHNRHGPKIGGGSAPLFGKGELGPHLTQCGQVRGLPVWVQSFILIHPTVRPQYTNVTDRQTGEDRTTV